MISVIRHGKEQKLASKTILRKSFLSRAFGLMLRFNVKDEAHVFFFKKEKIIPLHMIFVFTPIDVLFLNKQKKVVETKSLLTPFTFYKPSAKAIYVVELPPKTIPRHNIIIRDQLKF